MIDQIGGTYLMKFYYFTEQECMSISLHKKNKININVQLNRELIEKIKDKIKEQNISLKEYIEKLLKNKL